MSSGGLGYTDIGNKYVIRGLALDFYRRLGRHYGKLEQWIFEPKEAEAVFNEYIRRAEVEVWYDSRIVRAANRGGVIRNITLENSVSPRSSPRRTVRAKVFIDCSYEGDLMARAGVSYTVGREGNERYGRNLQRGAADERTSVSRRDRPYIVRGDSASGCCTASIPIRSCPTGRGTKKCRPIISASRLPIVRRTGLKSPARTTTIRSGTSCWYG